MISKERLTKIGKCFDTGLISYDALCDYEKWALNRYYAIKNEELDGEISRVSNSLIDVNNRLDDSLRELNEYSK